MKHNESQPLVREIMMEFAGEAGLSPARKSPRATCYYNDRHKQTQEVCS
jgi:hypothetical protein